MAALPDNVDDDGWDSESETGDKQQQMETLRDLQAVTTTNKQASDDNSSSANPLPGQERDLFIPIFVGVAIAGFTGVYAYETLRLYLRGELYLPF